MASCRKQAEESIPPVKNIKLGDLEAYALILAAQQNNDPIIVVQGATTTIVKPKRRKTPIELIHKMNEERYYNRQH